MLVRADYAKQYASMTVTWLTSARPWAIIPLETLADESSFMAAMIAV